MTTITALASGDSGATSLTTINTNFTNLNNGKIETTVLDTDTTLAANSDTKVATQKAVKAYVDAGGNVNASTIGKGIVQEATQAQYDAGTATGSTGARLFINPSLTSTKFSTTQVFTGTSPNALTDLDLSSVVGAKQRTVMLIVTNNNASAAYFSFIRKGSGMTPTNVSSEGGSGATGNLNSGTAAYVITTTNTSGVVQWIATSAVATVTVSVESFW